MDIYFVTGNRHKVEEGQLSLAGSGIKLHILDAKKLKAEKGINIVKQEPDNWSIEEVASKNAKRIADETGKTVIVEDTGVFFEAFSFYPDGTPLPSVEQFPGAKPKRYYIQLGYEGILQKFNPNTEQEITNRKAFFKAVIGYCEPNKEPILFSGELHGTIAKQIKGIDADVLEYERIFVCEDNRYLYEYPREEKEKISHRGKVFRKLREYLENKK
ncbi:MAG: non-canonical purine NTP pyrophosphatase [Candidatus Woesearchaeota archaeon]